MSEKQSKLFKKTGAFFAFSQKQYDEQSQNGVVYVNMGHGMICPKKNASKLIKGLDKIILESIEEDVNDNGPEAIIRREYFNHESQLTGCTEDAFHALREHIKLFPKLFSKYTIALVFKRCYKEAIEKDLF